MKIILTVTAILFLVTSAYAQQETLIGGEIESGGFGGPEVKFANINGDWEVLVGGKGAWIINHKFFLGCAGYGMATHGKIMSGAIFPRLSEPFEIGYGGVLLGYISKSDRLIHVTVETLIGGGGISYNLDSDRDHFGIEYESDGYFIVEPNVNFVLNITERLRFGFGAGYRFTSDVDYRGLGDDEISGTSINLMLKFGRF